MPPPGSSSSSDNSSNFRPCLDPIDEDVRPSHHRSRPGKDATQRVSDNHPESTDTPSRIHRHPALCGSSSKQPKKHATSEDLHRLMMADVPASPRPQVADNNQQQQQQHQTGTSAISTSSSQDQRDPAAAAAPSSSSPSADTKPNPEAPADTETEAAPGDNTNTNTNTNTDPDAEPAPPKLDPAGFFTLVSNSTTNTTHHPTVKYIFLDDDPDTLTSALADHHAANQTSTSSASTTSKSNSSNKNQNQNQPSAAAAAAVPAAPNNNRAVLLDVVPGPDGQWKVSSAASLSADFAVTEASISRQEGEERESGGGLVLKIEGVESEGGATSASASATAGGAGDKEREKDRTESLPSSNSGVARSGGEEYGPLLEDFERRMSVMRRVVKAGEGRADRAREGNTAAAAAAAAAAGGSVGGGGAVGGGEGDVSKNDGQE